MFHRIRRSTNRHPLLRDAILWALPALFFGALLRGLLLTYQPYAYWGSDSNSYFSFAHMLLGRGLISLDEKRRLLYPLLMVPVSLLPGAPLRSVAWVQHALGLLTILPFAYVVRKSFVYWRAWIVPVTLLYAANPIVVWYEHELIGDSLFFAGLVWAFAGWTAWAAEPRGPRARSLFWWFFAGLAIFLLTKPSGRFVWPGIVFGLLLLGAWRTLNWKQWSALFALCLVGNMLGSKKQGAWLFYTATFPLTQLDTPLHAEYKAQIRDLVEPLQRDVSRYFMHSKVPFDFLERPGKHPERPLWHALATDAKKRTRIYMDLAIEGVKARPGLFLALSLQRAVVSANPSYFKTDHFAADYFARRFEHHYEEAAAAVRAGKPTAIPMLFGLPRTESLPPYDSFRKRLAPHERSPAADWLTRWAESYERHSDLFHWPTAQSRADRTIDRARPTPLGWWMLAGALLAFGPRYRSNIGVFTLVAAGYIVGVFLVSLENARYFAPALPLLIILLAVPADQIARLFAAVVRARRAPIP